MSRIYLLLGLAVASMQSFYATDAVERVYLRLTVTLTDMEGDRLVPGLTKEDFEVLEEGKPQFIEYFSATPSPSSVTILLDMDGSMRSFDLDASLNRLVEICNAQSVPDEVSLIAFSTKPSVVKGFAWKVRNVDFSEVLRLLEMKDTHGQVGLAKALAVARERMQIQARNHNRAVVLITDAEEDFSHSTTLRIQQQVGDQGLRVYGIFFAGEDRLDYGRLHNLATMTGGRYFRIDEPGPLELLLRWILHELRYQYVIGFTPNPDQQEGNERRISVKLSRNRLTPGTSVRFTETRRIGRTQVDKHEQQSAVRR